MSKPFGTKSLDDEAAVYITGPDGKIIGHTGIAKWCKSPEEANAVTMANVAMATRIAACLNACEGLSTEQLERVRVQEAFQREESRADAAERQRDELLAALEQIASSGTESTARGLQQLASVAVFAAQPTNGPTIAKLQDDGLIGLVRTETIQLTTEQFDAFEAQVVENPLADNKAAMGLLARKRSWLHEDEAKPTTPAPAVDGGAQ